MSLPTVFATPETRSRLGWTVLRLVLAVLIAAHGWVRWLDGGVPGFGDWLGEQGFPFGLAIASAITAYEILGTMLLAWGRFVLPLTLAYSFIYAMGIVLVHAPEGWFVVGAGRNGMEYSVLLIGSLALVALRIRTPLWHAFGSR